MSLTLEPMGAAQFASWMNHVMQWYAQGKVDAGSWPEEGAFERARRENAEQLPDGVQTPGNHFFVGTVDGREVGFLWLHSDPDQSPPTATIEAIEVLESERGQGLGRALLEAAEGWCADHSIATLRLHVFGRNTAAINLYESAGFEATNVLMAKTIR
ncbi:GNAT family N-acetyltransferase [Aeromicrobium yanjiei]|uniref:GNAT family N-acetyltransferase n=1 Tax=Aeromicrobium yanjiei TaxID=2662028 RepID=A0A5Q2MM05_9ACTN|nr:GNAT family N-acetyltransferase [Aeromicrobium yanjiei]QGG40960.1 GNAT family N-acetyltransferase [Aeromicrobium yanjiei]